MNKLLLLLALAGTSPSLHAQCNATITPIGSTTICQPWSVRLVASQGDAFQWCESGMPINGATNDTFYAYSSGNYSVIIDSAGCIDTSGFVTVTVNSPLPAPGLISGPDTVCNGSIQTFSTAAVPGATSYIWQGVSSQGVYVSSDTTILPTITGNVSPGQFGAWRDIYVQAANGCVSSLSNNKRVRLMAPPQVGGSWNSNDLDVSITGERVCPGTQYKLHPIIHGAPGYVDTDPYTLQWCLNNVPIPGETGYYFTVTRGGNYSVKVSSHYCGFIATQPKKVYQDVPNSITISPAGPLSYCIGNATPLIVTFDVNGVSDPFSWGWSYLADSSFHSAGGSVYSIMPIVSGYYMVGASSAHDFYGNCNIHSNYVYVSTPPALEITQVVDTLFATPGYNSYQWYESGVPLTGATSQSHVLTFDGIYSVEAVFSNGCIETSDTMDPNFLPPPPDDNNGGQQNTQTAKNISVYPNPVVGEFTLVALVPLEDKSAGISIMDVMGKVIYQKDVEVKDGRIEQKIQLGDNIQRFGIIKVRSKGANRTLPFYKKE